MKNRYSFNYFFSEGLRSIFLHGVMSFAAISVITACLLITGSIALISVNIGAQITDLQDDSEIAIYIDETFTRQQAENIADTLESIDNISEIVFVSSEQALDEYKEMLGDDELFEGLDAEHNPMRDGYRIKLVDLTLLDETAEEILAIDGVAHFVAQEETIDVLTSVKEVFEIIALTLIIALGAVSIFIISNTVKLGMFARREEIAIMKMVGATNWFIRWPFVIEGMILGLISAFLSFFIQWGIYYEFQITVSEFLGVVQIIEFNDLWQLLAISFATAGLVVGIGGSSLTIRKFLDV